MKRLLLFLVCLMLQVTLLAQDSKPATDATAVADSQPTANSKPAANSDRMFFPKDWYWGWAQFDITPPHNEADPNLCAANAGQFGGVHSQCSAFGRYMISGTVELRPFGRTFLRRVHVFYDPTFLFGKNIPQTLYTWSWSGIGMEYDWGAGIDLPKRFEFRVTTHPQMQRFGARDQPLGPAYLGPNGPYGRYNAFGVRKYFGTRREGTY
ncbi:MAG: hypothetical protein WBQ76_13790 [Candidatus Korobacteraceae bacterium]